MLTLLEKKIIIVSYNFRILNEDKAFTISVGCYKFAKEMQRNFSLKLSLFITISSR